jgi:hypothetical protein
MKVCGKCRTELPVDRFHQRGRGLQTWCKDCRKVYDREYHAATRTVRLRQKGLRRAEKVWWYRALKSNTPCADCGGFFHHAAMTWDHLPGSRKAADISDMVHRRSRIAIITEIDKCELVCANCHAVRTHERRGVAQPG